MLRMTRSTVFEQNNVYIDHTVKTCYSSQGGLSDK